MIKKIALTGFILIHLASAQLFSGEIKAVSLAPNITEILFAIGLDEKEIVGITDYCDYPKGVNKILRVGSLTTVSIEKIMSLEPDYVFSTGSEFSPLNLGLKKAGLNVIVLNAEGTRDIFLNILTIGKALHREENAKEVINQMKMRLGKIEDRVKKIYSRKKVYVEIWDDPLTSCGRGSLVDEVVNLAGGVNITGKINIPYPTLNQEFIIKENPDIIILGYMSRDQKGLIKGVLNRFGWQDVSAVRKKHVISDIDPNIFLRPSPRIVEGIEEIHKGIYENKTAAGPTELSKKIFLLRIVRLLLGITAGAGLAVCGVVFQAILRNPLAEPYVLGISSGAGLGAVVAAVCLGSAVFLPIPAFLGAAATIFLVYNLAKTGGNIPIQDLLLSGVVVNILFSSLILFFIATAKNPVLHDSIWWLLGNLQIFDIKILALVFLATIFGIFIFLIYSRELNAICVGEEEAIHLGIDTERVKRILFIVTSLVTAVLVSTCGLIGFAGLIIPHIARVLVGPNHKVLIPVSAILGGVFLVLSDILARMIMPPIEIPIGVITSILGGPFFLFLLRKSRKIKQR